MKRSENLALGGPEIGLTAALVDLNKAAKEWIGLIAYRLMGKTDALFPGP